MPRCDACTSLASRSPMTMSPADALSSPAMMRSSVDLPDPDGPTKTTNSPDAICKSTSDTTNAPSSSKRLSMWRRVTDVMRSALGRRRAASRRPSAPSGGRSEATWGLSFHCAGREALDEVALAGEEGEQHRQRRHRAGGHHQVVAMLELVDEEANAH